MAAKLNKELANALQAAGGEGLEVIDPDTNRVYRIIDEETHRKAMGALRAQQNRDAIAEGIAQMEAGAGKPAGESFEELRERLGFPEEIVGEPEVHSPREPLCGSDSFRKYS